MEFSIEKVSKVYPGGKKALRGVTAKMKTPELIGLMGPNGAGKST